MKALLPYIEFLCNYPRVWPFGSPRGEVRGSIGLQQIEQALREQEGMSYSRFIDIIDETEKAIAAEGLLFEIYVIKEMNETQCFRQGETFKQAFDKLRNIAKQTFPSVESKDNGQ